MAGTGSEMNGGSVITNHEQNLKIGHVFSTDVAPKFAIMNPEFTYSLPKFARFAQNVWGIDAAGKADEQLAAAGLDAMEAWMREIGCVMNLAELGCDESMLEKLADATFVMEGGYRKLTREEIITIFRESL